MIQRIQTVYLLAVILLIAQVFFFPFLVFFDEQETIQLNALKISSGEYVFPLTILFGIIEILTLLTIFFYKRRVLQLRLIAINILLLLGSVGLVAYFGWQIKKALPSYLIQYNFACLFPVVAIIFNYLALRAIRKDEALVRSASRIR